MFDQLTRNIIVFVRSLHALGLPAQPDRAILFLRAVERLGWRSRADLKAAGRCIFVRSHDQRERFDAAFDAFWTAAVLPGITSAPNPSTDSGSAAEASAEKSAPSSDPALARLKQVHARSDAPLNTLLSGDQMRLVPGGDRSFTYSFTEALSERDFSRLAPDEAQLAHRLARQEQLQLGLRRSRRTRPGRRGGNFDVRQALRAGIHQYGEVLALPTRVRTTKQRDIVLLCDISGSMDRHTRLLLQFIHAMRHALGKVEAFVFGTRLTRITHEIRHRDINTALNEIAASVADWGGGTRIGECLRDFNQHWARRVLAHGAIVIIISDGWDRGDIDLLAREMQRLQRRSYRLIWLNPLLGSKSYRPQTVGMQAALPYIDDFLPAHDLKGFAQLIMALRSVDRHRPFRRQSAADSALVSAGTAP